MNRNTVPLSNIKRLHLEMGYFCNIRCVMCYQDNFKSKIPKHIWEEKLIPVYPHIRELILQGGEVTAMPEARDLIRLVKKHNPKILFSTTTNGLLFDDFWQDEFISNGSEVNFSLNTSNKKTYESMMKHSNYDKVIANLKKLIEKRNKTKSHLKITISLVIRPENITELSDFIKFGKELGVDKVRFYFDKDNQVSDKRIVEKSVWLAWDTYRQSKIEVEGLANYYSVYCYINKILNIFATNVDNAVNQIQCPNPWQSLYIDKDGNIRACCQTYVIFGNLQKDDLEKAWNSFWAVALRKDVKNEKFYYCMSSCPYVTRKYEKFTYAKFKLLLYMIIKEPSSLIKRVDIRIKKLLNLKNNIKPLPLKTACSTCKNKQK